jgi:hypothetical protein
LRAIRHRPSVESDPSSRSTSCAATGASNPGAGAAAHPRPAIVSAATSGVRPGHSFRIEAAPAPCSLSRRWRWELPAV